MLFRTRKEPLKCFYQESRSRNYSLQLDRGIQTVNVDKIVGSVGRCLEFSTDFSVIDKQEKSHILNRAEQIKQARNKGVTLPPIKLYKMNEEYYVLDGHHRILAATEEGQKFMDAHIIEYIPSGNSNEKSLAQKRIEFETRTGLQGIILSDRDDYDKLISQIEEHKRCLVEKEGWISFREAARDWYQSIYYPVTEKIREFELPEYFNNSNVADIYTYLCEQIRLNNRKKGRYQVGLEEALEELGILARATKLLYSPEDLKDKILKIFRPCYYLGTCKYS